MNYTDLQLQIALAKMLPDKLAITASRAPVWLHLLNTGVNYLVLDTEWLHVCYLVENGLSEVQYRRYVGEISKENPPTYASAGWQQRAAALAKVKGVEIL